MYIANQNFKMHGRLVRRNETFDNVDQAYITRGLVREVKIVQPETLEVSNADQQPKPKRRGRKPKAQTQPIEQSDI